MTIFLIARALHIIAAALWVGAIVFISFFLMPVLQEAGPEGGKIMGALDKRGLVIFLSSAAGFTILMGIYLFWHLTGFAASNMGTHEAMVFGTGGALGLVAFIIGGSMVGASAKKASVLGAALAAGTVKDRAAAMEEIQMLRRRMVTFGHIVIALLLATMVLMSIGHYV